MHPALRVTAARSGWVVAVVAASMMAAGCVSQSSADDEAAFDADTILAPRLDRELERHRGEPPSRQAQAIHDRLVAPDAELVRAAPDARWVAGPPDGSTVPVAVYHLWNDTSFVNERRWGRVCRVHDVGASTRWRAVTCPDDVPDEPPPDAVGGASP